MRCRRGRVVRAVLFFCQFLFILFFFQALWLRETFRNIFFTFVLKWFFFGNV